MNWYFYRIWLPLQILTAFVFVGYFSNVISINWWIVLVSFFLIGPIGTGVGFHRLFSHRSFSTWRIVEILLALLGSLSAYGPLLFWAAAHQHHHINSDTYDDASSPRNHGFWESFLFFRLRNSALDKVDIKNPCVRRILIDRDLLLISKHFTKIVWGFAIGLLAIEANLLASIFIVPVFLEHFRINAINSLSHMSIPLSYRNHDTNDSSQNNIFLAYLTFGFAWHNNHHQKPGKLYLRERWWEFDIEGLIGKFLSKKEKLYVGI
jgi:stearoyl-CoA desaturase (delta-9 desaturase)